MDQVLNYFEELTRAMKMLAEDECTVFLGQGLCYQGTRMTENFKDIPRSKLIEMPVTEDMQLGMSIGMSLAGHVAVSVFPRWNFLLLAINQLVNHLDRLPIYSDYRPHVIVRVAAPSKYPLDPQAQHDGDFTDAVQSMCRTLKFVRLRSAEEIVPAYEQALLSRDSTLLVEHTGLYG